MSWQDLCTRSLKEVSWQDLCKGPLGKISTHLYDLYAMSLHTREGCASHLKMSTAPQRERSDRPKVTRGLRWRSHNSHRAMHNESYPMRAKWREGCASTCEILTKDCACHETWTLKKSKTTFYRGLSLFFVEVYKVLRLPRKMSLRHPKSCACHTESSSCPKSNSTTVSQNAIFDPCKTSSKFTKYCACYEKWPPKAPLILTHACLAIFATCTKCYPCHGSNSYRPSVWPHCLGKKRAL